MGNAPVGERRRYAKRAHSPGWTAIAEIGKEVIMVPLSFGSVAFQALSSGALFWPERQALLVADLHLEKGSWFAARGQMLPPYDSMATLDAVADAITRTDARELWCLGDSFHDALGCERLPADAQATLRSLTGRVEWHWIVGNHDPHFTDCFGGSVHDEVMLDELILRHEARPNDSHPELSGHFHPKFRVSLRGRSLSRRCFVSTPTKLILPAFGALTGGLDAHHPEIIRAVGRGAEALVPLDDRLLRFRIAA